MSDSSFPFAAYRSTPVYPDARFYVVQGPSVRAWEFSGWQAESMSWKKGCYIHAGLSGGSPVVYSGPGAEQFLSGICVNGFAKFRPGTCKHAVMCDEQGLITGHGVLQREASDRFRLFVHGVWSNFMFTKTELRVKEDMLDEYLFQIAGPTSLQALEAATGDDLHDIGFLRFKKSSIRGKQVEVMRIGMAGSLAYELHGPMEEAAEVYDAVFQAGRKYGMERLGWRTYTVNHVEGGYPQQIWTFLSSAPENSEYRAFIERLGAAASLDAQWSGSVDPQDRRARYRTPLEVGWEKSVNFNHEFVGKQALQSEHANPQKTIVTLVWNVDDVIDIYASLFRSGEDYRYLEMPTSPHLRGFLAHADHVLKDGVPVGISSGTTYSYYYRKVISHCTIDKQHAQIGKEVVVKWGDHGKRIKDVRATVERFPYYDEHRNQTFDVRAVPSSISA